jgi:hypothetical protein
MSESGCLILMQYPPPAGTTQSGWHFWGDDVESASTTPLLQPFDFATYRSVPRGERPFSWQSNGNTFYSSLPHWSAFTCGVILTLVPWIRWHFSLRTLLIATTIIGLLLGLIIATTD